MSRTGLELADYHAVFVAFGLECKYYVSMQGWMLETCIISTKL